MCHRYARATIMADNVPLTVTTTTTMDHHNAKMKTMDNHDQTTKAMTTPDQHNTTTSTYHHDGPRQWWTTTIQRTSTTPTTDHHNVQFTYFHSMYIIQCFMTVFLPLSFPCTSSRRVGTLFSSLIQFIYIYVPM